MMLNFVELYKELKGQRYFSIIIHSKPNTGLSEFAQKAAAAIGAKYINLLELFVNNKELSDKIQSYSDHDLQEFLKSEVKNGSAILLDKIDFLLDTWNKSEMDSFLKLFNKQWDTFNQTYKVPLIVFIETNSYLDELQINFENGISKVYHLSQFNAL